MQAPLAGKLLVTQGFASLRGGPSEAYDVWHDGTSYHCIGHAGIDLNAAEGAPVYAMKGGIVQFYGVPWGFPDDGYGPLGLHAVVTLPNGEAHWYAHLSEASVGAGTTVAQGQQIARSGATGNVSGPHLHVAWRLPKPNYANGLDGFEDFLTHFDAAVYPLIDLSLV